MVSGRTLLRDFVPIRMAEGKYGRLWVHKDITERKRVEETLREPKLLENLLNYANAPIIVWNPEFEITRFNHAFERLTGRTADEVISKKLDILFPADTREKSMDYIHKTVSGERWETVEIPIQHVNGSISIVLWNSATLLAADGKSPVATIAQGQDITERKEAEARLLSEKAFSDTAINSLPGVFYLFGQSGRFLKWNRNFELVTGHTSEEFAALSALDLFEGDERALIAERIEEVFKKGESTAEAHLTSNDHQRRLYQFTGFRMMMGDTPYLIGSGIDITERKKAEETLRETRDYLDNLLNYANAPIIVWNPEFEITRFNHALSA